MSFKKYEPKRRTGPMTHLTKSRFAFCWIGKTSITFNAAALELFGEGTGRLEIMWNSEERMFAFVPAPIHSPGSLKLQDEQKSESSGVKRITSTGVFKEFPELVSLHGRVWRILPDERNGYFEARFATQKEMTDYAS